MAEGFEPYHVPQQSRRDKLRVVTNNGNHLQGCAGLLPLYDPTSHLLSCAAASLPQTHKPPSSTQIEEEPIKEENHLNNLMNLYNNVMDPQNPSSIHHHNNNNPFLFAPQNNGIGLFNGGGNGEVIVYKPEPLSLSLSSNQTHIRTSLPLELNLQRYEEDSSIYNVVGSSSNDLSRSAVPLGPFTGYGSILKGSRFLKPAQLLLEEICDVGRVVYGENVMVDSGLMDDHTVDNLGGSSGGGDEAGTGGEQMRKKSRLISMLDEVYRRYKYYYQQMQAVVASFESVAGLSNAAPYANLALKAMSKHFRSLKNAITDQLQFTSKAQNYRKDETPMFGNSDIYSQRAVNSSGIHDQPVWRPQRGLPERAVTVLRSWLFEHFLHPYPTDTDKIMLAKQTGLSRNQVSNWFINARVRLWKPMVEEIHMLETRQSKKAPQREEQNADGSTHHLPTATSIVAENPSTSTKRTRNEFHDIPPMGTTEDPMSLSYANLSHHQHIGAGTSNVGGSTGVSLTLGLHQNNGIGLSEPFPINAARHFGLDSSSEGYPLGGFEDQNRHFGRDFSGGQLLHDFVG